MTSTEIKKAVWGAVKKTINKFRENPYYFFTESDIHSYFYHSLYCGNLEVTKNGRRVYLVHREYPTNFRYRKEDLFRDNYRSILLNHKGMSRGHYDISVINPEFADQCSINDIYNKNIRNVNSRINNDIELAKNELLFAIEFKYIINNSLNFIKEVQKDNTKLILARDNGAETAINLVFCNVRYEKYIEKIKDVIRSASKNIIAILVQSYYIGDKKMRPPRPIINKDLYRKI
jgi:hypothetical protein